MLKIQVEKIDINVNGKIPENKTDFSINKKIFIKNFCLHELKLSPFILNKKGLNFLI